MTLSGIECGDLYNAKQISTSKWVRDSSPDSSTSKRSSKDAGLDANYPEWGTVDSTPTDPESMNPKELNRVDSSTTNAQVATSTLPPMCEVEPDIMETRCVIPPPKRIRPEFKSKYFGDNPEIVIVKDWCEVEEKLKVFYKVKGADPVTKEEWDDHYQTVTEALKRYGSSYKRKMEHDFWRIERTMTPEKRKSKVMEFWSAVCHTGDVTHQNPFLHRSLWGRRHDHQPVGWSGRGLEGYDRDGEDGVILMDLCEEDHDK